MKASVESSIDELYKGPIDGFVAGRTALPDLKGGRGAEVKALQPRRRMGGQSAVLARASLYERGEERQPRGADRARSAAPRRPPGRHCAHHRAIGDAVTERPGWRGGQLHPGLRS